MGKQHSSDGDFFMNNQLKKWEMALALSLCITLCHGIALPNTVGCNWWGVIFPGLTAEAAAAQAWSAPGWSADGGAVELRFRLLDQIAALRK